MKKYTDEERQWVIDHPDYPSWLIQENFKEKFGKIISMAYIRELRQKALGSSNPRHFTGRKQRHRENHLLNAADYYGALNEDADL